MLRGLVVFLLLANGAFFLWSQGHLGNTQALLEQREPERLQQQIAPESVRVLNSARSSANTAQNTAQQPAQDTAEPSSPVPTAPALATAPEAGPPNNLEPAPSTRAIAPSTPSPSPTRSPLPVASNPPPVSPVTQAPAAPAVRAQTTAGAENRSCWQAGGFTTAQANALRPALALLGLPEGSWELKESRLPARWLVYLGRFDTAEQLERKRAQLREMKVEFRSVSTPSLSPGLSLGTYSSEGAAQQALQTAVRSGIRTARVVQERDESVSFGLRLPRVLPAQRDAVAALGPVLAGKALQACN